MEQTCCVIDDEAHARELLGSYILKTPGLVLSASYGDPLEALANIRNETPPDICFVDVDMPGINGIDLAGMINQRTSVIFTTSYREYALDAFEKNATDYLLKPISYPRFLRSLQKIRVHHMEAEDHFFIKTEVKGKLLRIAITGIRYVQSAGNYVEIHLEKEKVVAYLTLGELAAKLPASQFSQIHKSYLVAHAFIRSMEQAQLRLMDGTILPIGKTYNQRFMETIRRVTLISKRDQ